MSALELLSQMKEISAGGDDKDDHRTVVDFLRKLGRQPDDMLRLFDRNSYYTLHGRDADTVASEYFKSSACVRHWGSGDDRHPYLSINKKMGAEIIRSALLKQRRRVEVYSSDGKQWVLDRRGSPGNLQAFEDECLRDSDLSVDTSSVIVAVRLGRAGGGKASSQRLVGCAFVDCTVRTIRVSEFEDDEHLSTLESLICQQGTRECLLPAELTEPERAKLFELCELCEVPSTGAKKGSFSKGDVQQDLRRLLGARELHGRAFASESQLGLSAVCGLISYLELMGAVDTFGLWTLDWVDAAQFMRLDAGAMRCLSVEPQPGEPERNASLLGLFSCCKTAMGARLLRKWLKQPLLSRHDIEDRLETVDALFQANETRQLLRDEVLPKLGSDLDKLARAFQAKKATLREVVLLYHFVLGLPRLVRTLQEHAEGAPSDEHARLIARKYTTPFEGVHNNFTNLLRLVQTAVDLEAAQRHEFVLRSHFSEDLASLGAAKDEVLERIERHHGTLCATLGLDRDKLRLEADGRWGYCVRASRAVEKELRASAAYQSGKVKLNLLQTKKEGVAYQDSKLASMAEEYAEAAKAYDAEQKTLASKVVDTAGTFVPVVVECHTLLAELDVLLAFAHVATTAPEPFVKPTLVPPEDGRQRVVLRGCRHPCVERMDGMSFIKNDVVLVRGERTLQIVTGPNMGGKSTYIRAAGVNVLLAQVGSFVPCDSAEISVTDSILARVGAGDCQSRGVSTFMAEMLETATILKGATERSLVLIDELGRGTSTYDGFGLAWAIAEHLATRVGCCSLFTTHFHELTALAAKHPCIVNRHVSALVGDGQMTMLYEVADGPCDKAFGVHVAEVARFPPAVVASAKRKLEQLEDANLAAQEESVPPTAAEAERKRPVLSAEERAAGLAEVRSFLDEFGALPLGTMGAAEAAVAVRAVAAKLRAKGEAGGANPLVASLVRAA